MSTDYFWFLHYVLLFCSRPFTNLGKVKKDYEEVTSSKQKLSAFRERRGYTDIPLQCGFCLKVCKSYKSLGSHKFKKHKLEPVMQVNSSSEWIKWQLPADRLNSSELQFYCINTQKVSIYRVFSLQTISVHE